MDSLLKVSILLVLCSWIDAAREVPRPESHFCPKRSVETVTFTEKYETSCKGWWFWKKCSYGYRIASRPEVKIDRKACCPGYEGEDCDQIVSGTACTGGQVWNECGTCTPTCDNPRPRCTKQCRRQCECPRGTPVWQGQQCISLQNCPDARPEQKCKVGEPAKDASGAEIFCGRGPTRKDCEAGYSCSVHPTDRWAVCCPDEEDPAPRCTGGRVFRDCASSCEATCDNPSPMCTMECKPAKCQCPTEAPIWNGERERCITARSCPRT